jgi:hypothetical protein
MMPDQGEHRCRRGREGSAHHETQPEDDAAAQDEAAAEAPSQTRMEVPDKLVPKVSEMIARHEARSEQYSSTGWAGWPPPWKNISRRRVLRWFP